MAGGGVGAGAAARRQRRAVLRSARPPLPPPSSMARTVQQAAKDVDRARVVGAGGNCGGREGVSDCLPTPSPSTLPPPPVTCIGRHARLGAGGGGRPAPAEAARGGGARTGGGPWLGGAAAATTTTTTATTTPVRDRPVLGGVGRGDGRGRGQGAAGRRGRRALAPAIPRAQHERRRGSDFKAIVIVKAAVVGLGLLGRGARASVAAPPAAGPPATTLAIAQRIQRDAQAPQLGLDVRRARAQGGSFACRRVSHRAQTRALRVRRAGAPPGGVGGVRGRERG